MYFDFKHHTSSFSKEGHVNTLKSFREIIKKKKKVKPLLQKAERR